MAYVYCYVRMENTVRQDGILSPSKAPEHNIQHYAERAGSKDRKEIVNWLESLFPGRSRSISVLTEPIPYDAHIDLQMFAHRSMLCRIDITALTKDGYVQTYYKPNLGGPGSEEIDNIPYGHQIPWSTIKPSGKMLFQHVPHYFVVLKDGKVPFQYVQIIRRNESDTICPICGAKDKFWVKSVDVFHCPNGHEWFNWLGSDPDLPTEHETITFPESELEQVEWDLGARTFVYTTRIQNEKGKYKPGHIYKSPFGCRLKVESVITRDSIEKHPFYKELTQEQIDTIGDHPYEVLKLVALDTCSYDITGVPFPAQKAWLGSGDKAHVVSEKLHTKGGFEGLSHAGTEGIMSGVEAVSGDIKAKNKIIDYICTHITAISGQEDCDRYRNLLHEMSDAEFDKFMKLLREKKVSLYVTAPNLIRPLRMSKLIAAAKKLNVKIFHRLWVTDPYLGTTYLTREEYPVLTLPVRRVQQYHAHKISIPETDRVIDSLTGQVSGDARSLGLSNPEIQIIYARGLETTLHELVRVRGGDVLAWGDFKRQLEEQGEGSLLALDPNTRARAGITVGNILFGMGIENNL